MVRSRGLAAAGTSAARAARSGGTEEALGQRVGHEFFADAAGTAEQERVRNAAGLQDRQEALLLAGVSADRVK